MEPILTGPSPAVSPSTGPLVTLVDSTASAFDLSIATARTCYSGKGIIWPSQVSATEKDRELRDRIAESTMKAGHLTTRQHPHFVFAVDRISRHLVWSFLHSHPFYNSEQVSQRYVEVKPDFYYVPPSLLAAGRERAKEIYLTGVRYATESYFALIEALKGPAADEFFTVFPVRRRKADVWARSLHRKAMEVARYILPLSTFTYMYHTVSGLTLHRYRRLMEAYDVPEETRLLVHAMVEAVREKDPLYVKEMADPVPIEDTIEYRFFDGFFGKSADRAQSASREFVREFDQDLGSRISRLSGTALAAEQNLAASVRAVLGVPRSRLSDVDAIGLLLDPAKNNHLASTLNETTLSRVSRSLYNVQYTFQKKLSHTADSQDQRHRLVPAARPVLMRQFTGDADFVVPALVRKHPEVADQYFERMERLFEIVRQFRDAGGTEEETVYLLPNAFPVRFYESGDLLNLHHKWKARTCYNAQEEIFQASVEEVIQVSDVHPQVGRYLRAPCWMRKRAGVTPFCPEGDRYCGVPVWTLEIDEYERVI